MKATLTPLADLLAEMYMSLRKTKPIIRLVRPAMTQINLGIRKSDQSLRYPHEEILNPYIPIEFTAKTLIRLGKCSG